MDLVVPVFPPPPVNVDGPNNPNHPLLWNDPHPQIPGWPAIAQIVNQPEAVQPPSDCCWKVLVPGQPMSPQIMGGWTSYYPNCPNPPPLASAKHVFLVQTRHGGGTIPNPWDYNAANALVIGRILERLRGPGGNILQGPVVVILGRKENLNAVMPIAPVAPGWLPMMVETMDELDRLQSLAAPPPKPYVWLVSRSMSTFSVAKDGWAGWMQKFWRWRHNTFLIYQVEAHWPHPDPATAPPLEVPWTIDWVYSMKYVWFPIMHMLGQGQQAPAYMPRILQWLREEWSARTHHFQNPARAKQVKYARGNGRLQI